MIKFVASRLTSGNRIFPAEVIINDNSVTLKNPSIFSGKEKTIPFTRISSVDINSPIIGFSKIIIETTGEGKIESNGFTMAEVKEMKKIILSKIHEL